MTGASAVSDPREPSGARPDGLHLLESDVNALFAVGVGRRMPPVHRLARNLTRQPLGSGGTDPGEYVAVNITVINFNAVPSNARR